MMRNSNNHTPYFLIFILSIFSFKSINCTQNKAIFCPKIEQNSLLIFKQSLKDPNHLLSSWDSEIDCCKWEGVICSNSTNHVHHLFVQGNLSGEINPSLLNLEHLKSLDLSQNNFRSRIPSFIGSFTNLEYLNLSDAGFHGVIPKSIGNLSLLHTLSFDDHQNNMVFVDNDGLEWLHGLHKLEYLNMNGANLSKARNWLEVINTLPSLKELHFQNCSLDHFMSNAFDNYVNISSLTYLDLSHNKLHSTIPNWVFLLENLVYLDLSFNNIIGPIPSTNNATKLKYINLSKNPLNTTIPNWLYSCKDLEYVHFSYSLLHGTISNDIANLTSLKNLDFFGNTLSGKIPTEISKMCGLEFMFLTYNELQGDISDSFGNMSACFLASIKLFCLRSNHLHGRIPDQFGEFKKIQFLHFGGNSFSGPIPKSLGKLSSLQEFSLYGNYFSGGLPESFGQLSSLEELYIDDCNLEGVVTETHFSNLKKLKIFSAPGNRLSLNIRENWVPPFQLVALKLGSWSLGSASQIPLWIEKQKNITELDLSSTGISHTVMIPNWFWDVQFLNLSHNNLQGEIPTVNRVQYLYLSSNKLTGSLPTIEANVKELDLSNNSFSGTLSHFLCKNQTYEVEILHLAGNKLNGELPNCWKKWPFLKYLNVGDNNISGKMPTSIGFLAKLQSLNLYLNNLSGQLPSSMHNCTELVKIELSENNLDGNMPTWIGTSLIKMRILILHSNKFIGSIPSEICQLNSLQILDLSSNKFSGMIPRCVGNLTAMATERSLDQYDYSSSYTGASFLDSAVVATKGSVLQYDTILFLVTNFDLSSNNLYGDIPNELTSLVELRSLNLSRNSLSGVIPRSIGDMKELESLDLSRNHLSGKIPSSLSVMYSLNHMNLSYNELRGRIPKGTQIQSFDEWSFVGNDLCGLPLKNICSDDEVEVGEKENDEDGFEMNWFLVFMGSGYAVGFAVVCIVLLVNKPWRDAYFGLFFGKNV